jgi:NSS family neurotransmitter:Na+ symporter
LTGEASYIVALDTFVALMAGVIIFPACFTYGVEPNAGPALIFITLPNVFNEMAAGNIWGILFFVFMACAALTTVIAVFENIISYFIDVWGWSRKKTVAVNFVLMSILVLPCILGFNVWSHIQPLGAGTNILDLEDFIVSNNFLPIGSFIILLFCTSRYGWGYDKFIEEANTGSGMKFPRYLRFYLAYILPVIIVFVFAQGYMKFF